MIEILTTREQKLLLRCEETIKDGLEKFYAVGMALMTIRDQKLYRADYSSFEEYCQERWDMRRRHADRLIAAKSVVDQLTTSALLPSTESQVRPLLKLPDHKRLEAWERAVASAGNGRVTAKLVEAAARETPLISKPRSFGEPLNFRGLRHAPINEQGVVFLFGMVSKELGFVVESVHNPFTDCIAKRLFDARRRLWREVRIEFEYKSRHFLAHGHQDTDCDLIVCWENNWPDCPIEVMALKDAIRKLPSSVGEDVENRQRQVEKSRKRH
jgi:hypothetical protein